MQARTRPPGKTYLLPRSLCSVAHRPGLCHHHPKVLCLPGVLPSGTLGAGWAAGAPARLVTRQADLQPSAPGRTSWSSSPHRHGLNFTTQQNSWAVRPGCSPQSQGSSGHRPSFAARVPLSSGVVCLLASLRTCCRDQPYCLGNKAGPQGDAVTPAPMGTHCGRARRPTPRAHKGRSGGKTHLTRPEEVELRPGAPRAGCLLFLGKEQNG